MKLSNGGSLGFNGGFEVAVGLLYIGTSILSAVNNPQSSPPSVNAETIFYLETNLASANLTGANLTDANLKNAQLTDVNLSQAIFNNTKLAQNNWSNANFINTDVSEVDFKNPILICDAIFSDESIYEEHCQEDEEEEEEERES